MPNFQLEKFNSTQNAIGNVGDTLSVFGTLLSSFTTSVTREKLYQADNAENE